MVARSFARRKTVCVLGSFAGLILLPLWLWAVRAPDAAYAPLPDYDIRKGYSGLTGVNDPRIAREHLRLRRQRAAKLALTGEKWEAAPAAPDRAETEAAFGRGVSAQWNANRTVGSLTAGERPLSPPQAGNPEAAARQFLRTHQLVLGLDEATIASLHAVAAGVPDPDGDVVVFRQTVAGVPVYQAELKVSLRADNAVESVAGTVYPALTVSPAARLSAVEAATQAGGYLGPWKKTPDAEAEAPASPDGSQWIRPGAPGHEVLATEPGPEEVTTLSRGGFRREVRASRVVFPLTASQGREAWQVYLMKSPLESYRLVVDAEDGTLLNRTSLVKFAEPQGLVFLTNPDDGAQVLRSFVGDPKASRKTFVTSTQTGLLGNNVVMGVGADEPDRHFEYTFGNDYELNGLQGFDLNGVALRFTPNAAGGYDLSLPAFFDPPTGTVLTGFTSELGIDPFDDGSVCASSGANAPPGGFKFFGASVTAICISTNGNIIIGSSMDSFFAGDQLTLGLLPGRLMGLWHDFVTDGFSRTIGVSNPATGQRCYRWNNVREFGFTNSNSFSICLWGTGGAQPAGTIELSFASVVATAGMVGIHPGKVKTANVRTATYAEFDSPVSTGKNVGLVQVYPSHDDSRAAATNLFWAFNEIGHDREFLLGFNEKKRNMQKKNFTKKGLGNDQVVAASGFVVDGLFFNNAFFGATAEGICCPVAAFGLFTASAGLRNADSAFDTDIVVHEYGHGVSTRLAGALDSLQGGAMGEGWSDWFALDYSGDPVMVEYSTGNPTTGIRSVAYNSSSPYHLGHFGNLLGPLCCLNDGSTVFVPEVHQDGEIWATMLADLRTALLGAGVPATNVSKLIIKALKSTPSNASMLQARDGLVTAAGKLGLNQCALWQVFAANGFGQNAANNEAPDTLAGDSFSVFQSFDGPSTCGGTFSNAAAPLYSFSFDSAAVGATSADGWTGTGLWHVSDDRKVTAPNSFYFGVENSATYGTGFAEFGSLTSPALNLSTATHPVLEFSLFLVAEEFFPFDVLWVRASTDGGATYPLQLAQLIWDSNGAFRTIRIGLEDLAGQANVRIRFTFDTLDDGSFSIPNDNLFEGVYIDNVAIRDYTEN